MKKANARTYAYPSSGPVCTTPRDYLQCTSCFLRHSLDAAREATTSDGVQRRIMAAVLREAVRHLPHFSPPRLGREIHRLVREYTGNPDPYRQVKALYNQAAMGFYARLKNLVEESQDPFASALRIAIAGNIIDFGSRRIEEEIKLMPVIEDCLARPFAIDHVLELRQRAARADDILYLADNAGEIGFDRLFIEQLPRSRVTVAVKGSPVINDATIEDAQAVGLSELVEVIDNGSDVPGTILEMCSPEFQQRFRRADLVIAKGQGNYETLCHLDTDKHIFYLLKVKCSVVGRALGCQVGDIVVYRKAYES